MNNGFQSFPFAISKIWQLPPAKLILKKNEVHIWCSSVQLSSTHIESLANLLSSDEVIRMQRFHFADDQRRFIISRGLLRKLLGHYLGIDPKRIRFDHNKYGKPNLSRELNVNFNLSHSGEVVLHAIGYEKRIGIDVELIREDIPYDKITDYSFSESEKKSLSGLSDEKKIGAFFNCWTRKEAYIKAIGLGLSYPMSTFDVSVAPGAITKLIGNRLFPYEVDRWKLIDIEVSPEYAATLAVEGHYYQLKFWQYVG